VDEHFSSASLLINFFLAILSKEEAIQFDLLLGKTNKKSESKSIFVQATILSEFTLASKASLLSAESHSQRDGCVGQVFCTGRGIDVA
jgi:hypothetical protein